MNFTETDYSYKAVTQYGYVMGISEYDKWGPCDPHMTWVDPQWGGNYDSEQECIDALLDWQWECTGRQDRGMPRPTMADMPTVKIVKVAY